MTRFERDLKAVAQDACNAEAILKERKAEIDSLYQKGRREKNTWRQQIIAQEINRLQGEYNAIDSLV